MENKNNESVVVHLIKVTDKHMNPLLNKVVSIINFYLLKNKGTVSDFNIIKDIVERNCDAKDEEIHQLMPVPLYLGLAGTVLGIILGLGNLHFNYEDPNEFMISVENLVMSVKSAMWCSFMGLLCTTLLSALLYRIVKSKLEDQKNELYNFVQNELLPQLSEDANSTILKLQLHLQKFNEGFAENVVGFNGIMDSILETFDSQVRLTKQLQHMDVTKLANLNVNVLSELNHSMEEFEKFNLYLDKMNTFVLKTSQLTDSVNKQLDRTDDVKYVVDSLKNNIEDNKIVMLKLESFMGKVDQQQAVLATTAGIDEALTTALERLKQHVDTQISGIKEHTLKANKELDVLMGQERANLDRLKNLDDIGKMITAVTNLKLQTEKSNLELSRAIDELRKSIKDMNPDKVITASVGIPSWAMWLSTISVIGIAVSVVYRTLSVLL